MAASSATDTTSKTTEGTNSTTTEDCSIEDLQKEIEMLKQKIFDERLKFCENPKLKGSFSKFMEVFDPLPPSRQNFYYMR